MHHFTILVGAYSSLKLNSWLTVDSLCKFQHFVRHGINERGPSSRCPKEPGRGICHLHETH